MSTPEGRKDDQLKNRLELLPPKAIWAVGEVLTFGAKKYADHNWKLVPNAKQRYYGAALRHLFKYGMGEKLDPESGLSHLSHAAACLMFILEME